MSTKKCFDCKETKSFSEFNRNCKTKDLLTYYCKSCLKKQRKRIEARPQVSKEAAKEFHQKLIDEGKEYQCSTCKHKKTADHFYYKRDIGKVTLSTSQCKECTRDQVRYRKFGLNSSDVYGMLLSQDFKCTICNVDYEKWREDTGRDFHIDHCHTTGVIRGFICGHCNRGLGAFFDDVEIMESAIEYLKKERDIV